MKSTKISKHGSDHTAQVKQLKRVEGQVRGVANMIAEERYCIDILTQIKAIKASLGTIERKIIDQHLSHCVFQAVAAKNSVKTKEMLTEISDLLKTTKL